MDGSPPTGSLDARGLNHVQAAMPAGVFALVVVVKSYGQDTEDGT